MDRAALDAAYNNTAAVGVAKREEYVADWMKRSDVIRRTPWARIDLRYGAGARHRVDVFPCGRSAAPTLVYIHGGYWQMNDKEPYAFLGEGLLPLRHLPSSAAPLVVTVGLGELPELIRQSEEFAAAWQRRGLPGAYRPVTRHNHFSILEELARPDGAILTALKELALTP